MKGAGGEREGRGRDFGLKGLHNDPLLCEPYLLAHQRLPPLDHVVLYLLELRQQPVQQGGHGRGAVVVVQQLAEAAGMHQGPQLPQEALFLGLVADHAVAVLGTHLHATTDKG